MKKYFQELIREHFSFSAKEKRGMLVLAGILFCLLAVRGIHAYLYPNQTITLQQDEWVEGVRYLEHQKKNTRPHTPKSKFVGFYFDPNTISEPDMIRLGLSPKQAAAWIKYRHSGAVFRKAGDLKKLFFMNEKRYALWEPWIKIEGGETERETERERVGEIPFVALQLNSCDSLELVRLRGIGAYTTTKVLRYRSWLGGFVSHEQLKEIKGLRQEQIDTLIKHTTIDASSIKKIAINQANENELKQHPYIRYKAKIIVQYRTQHGLFIKPDELLSTGVIDEPLLNKLRPYLDLNP